MTTGAMIPAVFTQSDVARFTAKTAANAKTGCVEWNAYRDHHGYGQFGFGRKVFKAHQVAFVMCRGPIPDGLWVLHRCDNPRCVNPDHLYAGTASQNARDAFARGRRKGNNLLGVVKGSHKTHCPAGHAYEGDNLYRRNGRRHCVACMKAASRRSYEKRKRAL